jgi:hypothetical protein
MHAGIPANYYRQGGLWLIGPAPGPADTITIVYYAELGDLINPSDTNVLTTIAPDLIWYAGLTYAGVHFTDTRLQDWQTQYSQILGDLQGQADEDELSGGSVVSPALIWPDDCNGT